MRRVSLFSISAALVLFAVAVPAALTPVPQGTVHLFHHENVLGTSLELKVITPDASAAARAEAAVLAEIDRQAAILSSWDKSSEFSRWFATRATAQPVSRELFEVLGLFDRWRERTGGALDASAESITRVWKQAASQNRLPSSAELVKAVADARQSHWKLDEAHRTATHLSSTPLAMNSFVKSYIANHAVEAARAAVPLQAIVLNIGGDLVIRGDWNEPVQLSDPRADSENGPALARLVLRDRAIATSGDYRRGFDILGRHYSHIVDPRTGQPAAQTISATVVAPRASDAGALATACSVLSPDECRRAAANAPGAEFLLIRSNGQQIRSQGWHALEAPVLQTATPQRLVKASYAPAKAAPAPAWNTAFELIVSLELARIDDMRYRRPFVAVWIEDEEHFPLRTLALWFDRTRWLPDLKAWYHADRLRNMAEGSDLTSSLSSATRPPGKYTLKWDGKDNAGQLVKPGRYTVCIEAAREHGTYQIIRQTVDFNGKPQQFNLTGNTEVSSASLDYRKAAR